MQWKSGESYPWTFGLSPLFHELYRQSTFYKKIEVCAHFLLFCFFVNDEGLTGAISILIPGLWCFRHLDYRQFERGIFMLMKWLEWHSHYWKLSPTSGLDIDPMKRSNSESESTRVRIQSSTIHHIIHNSTTFYNFAVLYMQTVSNLKDFYIYTIYKMHDKLHNTVQNI